MRKTYKYIHIYIHIRNLCNFHMHLKSNGTDLWDWKLLEYIWNYIYVCLFIYK